MKTFKTIDEAGTFTEGDVEKMLKWSNCGEPSKFPTSDCFKITEAERKAWDEGDWYVRDEIIRLHIEKGKI